MKSVIPWFVGVVLAVSIPQARAAVTLTLTQAAGNVVVTGSGAANISDLAVYVTTPLNPLMQPDDDVLLLGPTGSQNAATYTGVTGPSAFGTGDFSFPASGTGQRFGLTVAGTNLLLAVPAGYISGTALAGTSTYTNSTLASLGLTPGTFVYSFGSGAAADSLTIQVMPEPSTWALLGVGAGGLGGLALRRRRA